jgi:hypothetical protein
MPRFVVLEHVWNGTHWDFMLETGAFLRTWAVDAPIVAGRELPARVLEDHRPIYLDYEGPVSENRGTVSRLDSGTYTMISWTTDHVRVEVKGNQLVGVVDLRSTGLASGNTTSWIFRIGNLD